MVTRDNVQIGNRVFFTKGSDLLYGEVTAMESDILTVRIDTHDGSNYEKVSIRQVTANVPANKLPNSSTVVGKLFR